MPEDSRRRNSRSLILRTPNPFNSSSSFAKLKFGLVSQVALERHTVAWRLTETFDRVFSFVIGVNFIFSIPMICMMTSQTVRLLNERHIHPQLLELLWFLVPWNGSCIFFTILTCTFAATVNTAVSCAAPSSPETERIESDARIPAAIRSIIHDSHIPRHPFRISLSRLISRATVSTK